MKTLTVGLIPSPDLPASIAEKIKNSLNKELQRHVDPNIDWQIDMKVDSLIGAAEYVNKGVDEAAMIKQQYNWDFAISLTDLPSFSGRKAVVADVSTPRGAGLVSLPSFGAFPLKRRIRKALTFIIKLMYIAPEEKNLEETASHIKWRFLASKIKRVVPQENNNTDARFILRSRVVGWLRVLSGMTFANRPWLALGSFKKVLTLAFATGTYISIFTAPWELSVAYSTARFVLLMLLSITGMVVWMIYAHNLWEKVSSFSQNQYRKLYNVTTVMTLSVITIMNYTVLYVMFMLSTTLFVPEGLFEAWTDVNGTNTIGNLLSLAWLISSLGMLAGAVGSTAEKEETIRHITYAYRQLNRYYEIEQYAFQKQASSTSQLTAKTSHEGTQQKHKETDLS